MRRNARSDNVRDLILDQVDVLLARYGFSKMTMEDLARVVGIGKGTIYLYFPSKGELALAHVDRIVERLLERLAEIARGTAPVAVRIKKMLLMRVLFRFDSVVHYSQNLNDLLSSVRKELLTRRKSHFEKEALALVPVLEEGREGAVFGCRDPLETARVFIWSTNSLLPFSLTARELGKREEIEERVSRIADLLIKGLRTCSRRRPRRKKKSKHRS
jgi:AcrR family transcriptional regulator